MNALPVVVATDGRSDRRVRAVYIANLAAQCAIVVTGAIVRVTGSGLGCPTWPECTEGSYTPTARQTQAWHKYVEFGNRMLTFVLVVLAIAAVVAAIMDARRRSRSGTPRRPVLMALACVPILGTVAQAVLGGVTVRTGLHPATVSAHFLVSMLIVAGTAALVVRSADAGDGRPVALVPRPVTVLAWALVAVSAVVVLVGAVVTGSGPYSGDAHSENRYSFDPRTVSWLHADAVLLFTGMLIGLLVVLAVVKAPRPALRRTWLLLGIALAQGALGYTQYFAGEPVALVTVHVLGSVLVWVTVVLIPPTLRTRS